ncbi:MAG TPA: ATP-binding protein [Miltoncostaeaceae bacterium]|nr:ATP-binding protein [Miltoncostaeaceae bacterium]
MPLPDAHPAPARRARDDGAALDLRLPATLPAGPAARSALQHLSVPLPPDRLADVLLALTEAVTNAALHAEPRDGCVRVRAWVDGDCLRITVSDRGRGFDPDAGERGPRTGLGVGLRLMRALADESEIRTPPGGGAEIRLAFRP